ncbi:ABC transporter substrate-binding protein [Paracraurococcus lichenis]|uniref:ABC transporter substrate-binding protein n=1 Tax=Paracraurococcus lichenis TaxID=3064888 RepID=A0ABT9E4M7_9PROT|nr:ABC transporter substrate-binding protein [Paracraurococcus sp. LOR1-02]MDO9711124.1 ABC transporter substrate-binding protein [Paracraurococcus sp. LOR1-02]
MPAGRRALLAASLAGLAAPARAERRVGDATGRRIGVPDRIARVVPAGPPAAILLYTLAPELLAGWPARPPSPAEAAFLTPEAATLPQIGRLTGRDNTANLEAVLAQRPDLVLDYGATGPTYVSLAERIREQTGLPALLLDGALPKIPETYRLLGGILDRPAEAAAREQDATRILAGAAEAAETLRARGRPRVLYLRGPRGLETGLAGSINTEIIEAAGAENVAGSALGPGGLVQISLEQVLAWAPDWIICQHPDALAQARQDPLWRALPAVQAGRIVLLPGLPFGWMDFPPSVNRLLGLLWLPVLFGVRPREGLAEAVAGFHERFYHRRPAASQVEALLRPALPPA